MCRSGPYGPLGIASSGWVDYVIIAFAVDVLVGGPYGGGPRVFAVERRRTLEVATIANQTLSGFELVLFIQSSVGKRSSYTNLNSILLRREQPDLFGSVRRPSYHLLSFPPSTVILLLFPSSHRLPGCVLQGFFDAWPIIRVPC